MLTKEEKKNKEGYCKCGCGKMVRVNFISGHNRRGKKNSDYQKRVMSILQSGDNNVSKRPEVKEKMRLAKLGKKFSEEHKRKLSISNSGKNNGFYGKKHSLETIEAMKKKKIGSKVHSEEHKKNMSLKFSGINNPSKRKDVRIKISCWHQGITEEQWNGFLTENKYCDVWNDREYREDILERDNHRCQNPDCWNNSKRIARHHINYDKKDCNPNNLIILCTSCNSRANANRDYWESKYSELVIHA